MKLKHIILGLLLISQLACTGCWCLKRNRCCGNNYTRGNACQPAGCNDCSNYASGTFGQPMHGSAMTQAPMAPVDERLGTPAKQTPYEGPTKK